MPGPRPSAADRYARLEKILSIVQAQQEFTQAGLRQNLDGQSPRLLANVVRDLASHAAELRTAELKSIAASVGETAYCQIMAGVELGRRVAQAGERREAPAQRILGSQDALDYCKAQFARLASDAAQEEFHVVSLDAKHQVLGTLCVSVGSLDRTLVHAREVFRPAIKDAAKAVIVVHNHPSGDPTPSQEDLAVTRRMEEAGKTLAIELLDHIVVARGGAVSIREYQSR
ncbi:MAG TPA: DNA repair protein RadC [Pirellulales bacterium]|jgi:DNA repair protein RadC|nr:DNA repair protein RadC [Pirellulales bacterium]